MGLWTNFLTSLGLLKRKVNMLVIGLDNSGKTTLITHFKAEEKSEIIPTVGFSVETFSRARISFTVFDMSGQGKYRDLWKHYYPDTEGIVFVIDSSDRDRVSVVKDELERMLQDKSLGPVPILFFANKMDIEGSMIPTECTTVLQLENIKDRDWTICACNALAGTGLDAGLDWLASSILK